MLINLGNEDFNELLKNETVLVDFYATWCGPCKMLGPVLESIANDGLIKIIKVDVDEHQNLARDYKVMSVPTMFIMKNGEIKTQISGFMPKNVLEEKIKSFL